MSIYQHFRPEEKEFIDQVLNWKSSVENNYAPRLTDFLDPREQFILESIIGHDSDCQFSFFGGYESAERKRALIFPDYYIPGNEDFQLVLFELEYPDKFVNIEHPQVLGSLMGLGLKRSKFGDILVAEKRVQFFSAMEISEYIRLNFHAVGKTAVLIKELNLQEVISSNETMAELEVTVSSMRLDAVLAALSKLSRQRAMTMIQQGLVKVNWKTVEQPSYNIHEGDMLSARGIGRIKILKKGDQTKKEKWRITAGKIK